MALTKAEKLELAALEQFEEESQPIQEELPQEQSLGELIATGAESFGQGTSLGLGDEFGAGVNALIDTGTGYVGGETISEAYQRRLADARARQGQFTEDYPKTAFGTRLAGNVATGIATGGLGGNLVAREAVLGGIEGFGSGEGLEERLYGAGTGTAFGVVGSKLGDWLGSVFQKPSASQRVADGIGEIVERVEKRAGKKLLTKAQRTGSPTAKRIEAGLETLPAAGRATQRIKSNFQTELNRKAAASIGMEADKLTDDVLSEAMDKIDNLYNSATSAADIPVYPDAIASMQDTIGQIKKLPSRPDTAVKIGNNIVEELSSGKLTAARYNELSQDVRGALFKAQKAGDSPNMRALSKINDSLDDIVETGLGGDLLDKFREARSLYRNFKVLTSKTGTINQATGDVSGKMLFNELAKGGQGYKVAGELGDLARLAKIPGVGDSGTASRLIPSLIATGVGTAGLAGAVDISGGMIGSIGAMRLIDELAQQGLPGITQEGMGMLGGALSRARE
jgi:hypothetical protein